MKIREAIKEVLDGEELTLKEICLRLSLKKQDYRTVKRVIRDMQRDNIIVKEDGKFRVCELKQLEGVFTLNRKSFGFVSVEGEEEDFYIPPEQKKGAMTGDRVVILTRGGEHPEGVVKKILERHSETLVGTFKREKQHGVFIPDNEIPYVFYIPRGYFMKAESGSKVVMKIKNYPDDRGTPKGEVVEVLGFPNDKGTDVLSIIRALEIPDEFKEETLEEARALGTEVKPEELEGRKDYTNLTTFTIDGADAKDFDDAVSIEKLPNGNYSLGVHIADVSHYVKSNSSIDREALERGNSVYLISKVCPMLPKELSNGLCSLNEGVIRLTFSLVMEIDEEGEVVNFDLSPAYIKSRKRLVYSDVSDFLETGKTDKDFIKELAPDLLEMKDLYKILQSRKFKRGAVDFEIAETEITLDENDMPTDVRRAERRIANRVIEEFMLIANETVAKYSEKKGLKFIYRVHEEPNKERIFNLSQFLSRMGLGSIKVKDKVKPKEIQNLLLKVKGTKWEGIIAKMTLRAMAKARYYEKDLGHYGLALEDYTHFTSPIRRYSDLTIHRILKGEEVGDIPKICEWISYTERRADEAEESVTELRIAQYMSNFIDEKFVGTVSGVKNFGLFVELENTAEGLCRFDDMQDYFVVDELTMTAQGQKSGKVYRPGDEVMVKVDSVNIERHEVDFILIEDGKKKGKRKKK